MHRTILSNATIIINWTLLQISIPVLPLLPRLISHLRLGQWTLLPAGVIAVCLTTLLYFLYQKRSLLIARNDVLTRSVPQIIDRLDRVLGSTDDSSQRVAGQFFYSAVVSGANLATTKSARIASAGCAIILSAISYYIVGYYLVIFDVAIISVYTIVCFYGAQRLLSISNRRVRSLVDCIRTAESLRENLNDKSRKTIAAISAVDATFCAQRQDGYFSMISRTLRSIGVAMTFWYVSPMFATVGLPGVVSMVILRDLVYANAFDSVRLWASSVMYMREEIRLDAQS